jgi:hypothetical protein
MEMMCTSAQIPRPNVQRGEYASMVFHIEGSPLLRQYPLHCQPSQLDTIIRELEIPRQLIALWDVMSLTWKLNSPNLWYEMDLARTEFAIYLFRSHSPFPEPGTELISF